MMLVSHAPPEKGEAQNAVDALLGFKAINETVRGDYDAAPNSLQVISERMDCFQRLEHLFSASGWSLYPLYGEAMLAVHRQFSVSHVCHSTGEAFALLRHIRRGC
jgi:hypothetical protein